MYTMDNLVDSGTIPYSLAKELPWNCIDPRCKAPILYSDNLRHASCSNPYCPQHMSMKVAQIFSDLKMKGLGPAFARQLIVSLGLRHQLAVFNVEVLLQYNDKQSANFQNYWNYLEAHPTVEFWKLFTYLFIQGKKDEWMSIVGDSSTTAEVAAKPTPNGFTEEQWTKAKSEFFYIDALLNTFDVTFQHSNKIIEVTLTGSINGYSNRNDFITDMNNRYGHICTLKQVGKKKSAHFLVADTDMTGHAKLKAAQDAGVPVVSSKILETLLANDRVFEFLIYTKSQRKFTKNLKI